MNILRSNWIIILLFFLITLFFFYPVFLGKVPIPLDALVGGYLPWLDYKWGYPTGIPVKNPIISDVFSQLLPWRILALDVYRNGSIPLWNPYSFSGSPLAANWQSAVFYPLNILLLLFGNLWGWVSLVMLQPILAMSFMYLFLKKIGLMKISAILGGVVFAFSGLMVTHLEYNTSVHGFLWLPLILLIIEHSLTTGKKGWLLLIPVINFLVLTAGSFQTAFYTLVISFAYYFSRTIILYRQDKQLRKKIIEGFVLIVLSLGMAAVQLFPTWELFSQSVRGNEAYIIQQNYGLLPLQNILTFFFPDFFGNHTTQNYWGVNNYFETVGYFGVMPIALILIAITAYFKRRNYWVIFSGSVFLLSLLLAFDNFLGRLVYQLDIPFLSTSYASRNLFGVSFASSILAALGLNELLKKTQSLVKIFFILFLFMLGVSLALLLFLKIPSLSTLPVIAKNLGNFQVAWKNTIPGLMVISSLLVVSNVIKYPRLIALVILVVTILDLWRFHLKFNPFSDSSLFYPNVPVLTKLKDDAQFYRIEREMGEVIPPNTWIAYQLMTPSGYDPLYPSQYARFCNVYNGNNANSLVSRYCELEKNDSPLLDLAGVKYFIAAKRNDQGALDKGSGSVLISPNQSRLRKYYEDQSTVVLENIQVLPRVSLYNNVDVEVDNNRALSLLKEGYDYKYKLILNETPGVEISNRFEDGKAEIFSYQPNEVRIRAETPQESILMLSDTYYPGWKVEVNGREEKVFTANGIYRAVVIPKGESIAIFKYEPESFKYGLFTTFGSILVLLGLIPYFRKKI